MKNTALFAFIGGAIAGAAVALLLAPQSGAETRESIKRRITKARCAGGCSCGCAETGVCNCGPDCDCGCEESSEKSCCSTKTEITE